MQCLRGLPEEVLHRGQHATPCTILIHGIVEVAIQTSLLCYRSSTKSDSFLLVRMAVERGNVIGVVVEVPSPIGPTSIVEENHREISLFPPPCLYEEELMVDGVPVVVSINENCVVRFDALESIEAEIFVENTTPFVRSAQCLDIAVWVWINRVEDHIVFLTIPKEFLCVQPLINANFDDNVWLEGDEGWVDDVLEETVHGGRIAFPMRIGLVTPEFVTEHLFDGGLANYVYRVARTLMLLGHDVRVITSAGQTERMTHDEIPVERVAVQDAREWKMPQRYKCMNGLLRWRYDMAIKSLWQSRVLNRAVRRLHREHPFDIVQYAHLAGVGFFRPQHVPVVIRLSSSTRLCNEKGGYGLSAAHVRQQEWIERRALLRSDGIFGPSRRIAEEMSKEVQRHIEVIESPFFLDVRHFDDSVFQLYLAGRTYLLFFGSLCHIKGVSVIAAMIHRLLDRHPDLSFVFVGKEVPGQKGGSLMEMVWKNAGEHRERVIHIPPLRHSQLYPIIQGAHAVILPSRTDNFPNACIEAMAFGKVVIGTLGNGFEQLIHDGWSGFLCRVDDPVHLLEVTECMLGMTDGERLTMGRRAAGRINDLAPEKVGVELVHFYERVIASTRTRACVG